ncbi:PD-(D/E)XK nuclease family protein [Candidatus Pacearchaeota archaeon]|nr:PD-(D/E)XK nuclease family protein [Candidatus Pacearchaeota archaeon]
MKTYKLSPTGLNLMEDCERCFWLEHNASIERPSGIFPSLPSGMDRILKAYFDGYRKKGELPPELAENKEFENCKLFDNLEILTTWRDGYKGISLKDKRGNVLRGAVDDILVRDEKLIVIDYKTRGFPLKQDTVGHYKNQLDIYNLLLRRNGHNTEDNSFLFFYIPKEVKERGTVIFNIDFQKVNVNIKNVNLIWNRALSILDSPCPEKKKCNWCKNIDI